MDGFDEGSDLGVVKFGDIQRLKDFFGLAGANYSKHLCVCG